MSGSSNEAREIGACSLSRQLGLANAGWALIVTPAARGGPIREPRGNLRHRAAHPNQAVLALLEVNAWARVGRRAVLQGDFIQAEAKSGSGRSYIRSRPAGCPGRSRVQDTRFQILIQRISKAVSPKTDTLPRALGETAMTRLYGLIDRAIESLTEDAGASLLVFEPLFDGSKMSRSSIYAATLPLRRIENIVAARRPRLPASMRLGACYEGGDERWETQPGAQDDD